MIAQAQSGTGKTASIGICVLQKLDIQLRETQALILSPTRELAVQMQKVLLSGEPKGTYSYNLSLSSLPLSPPSLPLRWYWPWGTT